MGKSYGIKSDMDQNEGVIDKGAFSFQVSIAMATFNGSRFLLPQLESLTRQSLLPVELVICDDGSTDDTLNILERFKLAAPFPVRIFQNDRRLGYRGNFMQAASCCSGELIAFCDQDDIWHPDKIKLCSAKFSKNIYLVQHNASIYVDGKEISWLKKFDIPEYNCRLYFDPWWTAYGLTMIFRRDLLNEWYLWKNSICAHVPESKMRLGLNESHDHWVLFIASSLGCTAYVNAPLVMYRQHTDNAEGWGGVISFSRKLRHLLERRHLVYRNCHRAAKARSEILMISFMRSGNLEAQKSSVAYAKLGELYKLKYMMYLSRSLSRRFALFLRLWTADAYNEAGQWSWGWRGMIKDIILAVLFAELLKIYGFAPAGSDPSCRSRGRRGCDEV